MEEDLDVLEDKVAGLLHLEGEGVAVEPRAQGRKQHLPSTTR